MLDSLIVIGMAVVSLGTIHEEDGLQQRTFHLRNVGTKAVALEQGYTSCGCTTIDFDHDADVEPGDSTLVTLTFNPRGKGGEFKETGTLVYGSQRQRVSLSLIGTCITSEETLLRQFPIRLNEQLRLSTDRFDLGIMHQGGERTRTVVVLHRDNSRQERHAVSFTVTPSTPRGLQHIPKTLTTKDNNGKEITFTVTLDVLVR